MLSMTAIVIGSLMSTGADSAESSFDDLSHKLYLLSTVSGGKIVDEESILQKVVN